jgi:hypothetical protein
VRAYIDWGKALTDQGKYSASISKFRTATELVVCL